MPQSPADSTANAPSTATGGGKGAAAAGADAAALNRQEQTANGQGALPTAASAQGAASAAPEASVFEQSSTPPETSGATQASPAKNPEAPKKQTLTLLQKLGLAKVKAPKPKATETVPAPASSPKLTKQEQLAQDKEMKQTEQRYQQGLATLRDLLAPASMEICGQHIRIGGTYAKTFYVFAYPRYLEANWLSPVINFDVTLDASLFIYPSDSAKVMKMLRNKVAQIQSSININRGKGLVRDPALEAALQDAEQLRDELQRGQEKFFHLALYFTVYADDPEKIKKTQASLESILGGKLVLSRPADLQQEHGFNSVLPICSDELEIFRNMNTSPLSTSFPFSSSELTGNSGILYGLNRHNDSLILFDRFSLENANSVIFAKSGAGKSYAVKLELLRQMMLGTDVLVIDPENEYESLCKAVGGSMLRLSLNSERRMNPFDLPEKLGEDESIPDMLRSNVIALRGLLSLMLGELTPTELGIIDRALLDTYALRGITMQTESLEGLEVPVMGELEDVLRGMEGAGGLVDRLSPFTTGSFAGLLNARTNVELGQGMVVFCIRDLEEQLRPLANFLVLNFVWNRVRSQKRKRILVVDEAWSLMAHDDSAAFLAGLVKRARKYELGVTTITQDVEDFLGSPFGKPIISNSSLQLLMKQSPSSVEQLQKTFHLTEGEKYLLLNSGVGQGIFFAGQSHAAIHIIASATEDAILTGGS